MINSDVTFCKLMLFCQRRSPCPAMAKTRRWRFSSLCCGSVQAAVSSFLRAPCQEEEGGTMVDVPATVERALPEQYGGSHEVQHERFVVIFVVRGPLNFEI